MNINVNENQDLLVEAIDLADIEVLEETITPACGCGCGNHC
jgi:hypothetical protein